MNKVTQKDIKRVNQEFAKVYSNYTKIIEEKEFLTFYQAFVYVLKHFTDDEILSFLPGLSILFDKTSNIKIYKIAVDSWIEVTDKMNNDLVKDIMTQKSISLGEALIIADSQWQGKYPTTFLWSLYATYQDVLKVKIGEK